jgi:hypothetical protein
MTRAAAAPATRHCGAYLSKSPLSVKRRVYLDDQQAMLYARRARTRH